MRNSAGRRLVNGHLVSDTDYSGHRRRRRIHLGRCFVLVITCLFLIATNPSNRLPPAVLDFFFQRSKEDRHQQQWDDKLNRLLGAWRILSSSDESSNNNNKEKWKNRIIFMDDSMVNYLFFSVRESRTKGLQIFGAGGVRSCSIIESSSCRVLRNVLLPTNSLRRRHNRKQDKLEQLLLMEPISQRRYFRAYRIILVGVVLTTLGITLIRPLPSRYDDYDDYDETSHQLILNALIRGFWPNPYLPVASTVIVSIDLWLFVLPVLVRMEDLVANQSQQSLFRLTMESNHVLNYVFSVIVFLVGASAANLVIMANWADLWGDRLRGRSRLGYSSHVWAACALGYLRAVGRLDPDYRLTFHVEDEWQVTITMAIWSRLILQLILLTGISFSSIALWITADAIGKFIGEYQLQHHFVSEMIGNFWQGVDRFFTSFLGPTW